jgi:hypothetical protein
MTMKKMAKYWIAKGIKMTVFFLVAAFAMIFVVMTLWNALLPGILGVKMITFWQAAGLLLLSRILFGGFGRRGGFRGRGRGRSHWKKRWYEKGESMSEDEREQMKAKWKSQCGPRGRKAWGEERDLRNDEKRQAESEAEKEVDPTWTGKSGPDSAVS